MVHEHKTSGGSNEVCLKSSPFEEDPKQLKIRSKWVNLILILTMANVRDFSSHYASFKTFRETKNVFFYSAAPEDGIIRRNIYISCSAEFNLSDAPSNSPMLRINILGSIYSRSPLKKQFWKLKGGLSLNLKITPHQATMYDNHSSRFVGDAKDKILKWIFQKGASLVFISIHIDHSTANSTGNMVSEFSRVILAILYRFTKKNFKNYLVKG